MATATGPVRRRRDGGITHAALRVSAYDRVASMLLSLLIVVGASVSLLFVAWLSTRVFLVRLEAVPVTLKQVGGGSLSGEIGQSMQLDSPTVQDIARETDIVEPLFQDAVEAVLEVGGTLQAELADPSLAEPGKLQGGGRQQGTGDRLGYGYGDGLPGLPPHMRWEIRFEQGATLDLYARQLDFFKVQLGVVADEEILYAYNLSQPVPSTSTGRRVDEKRMYMSWRSGKLQEADRELLGRAGLPTAAKIMLQFYPENTEQLLLIAEKNFKGRDAGEIRKTRFGVRQAGNAFEFYVIDQTYL